jgi:two-component system, chemotaxis family, protein-glutamate methylesterase/glutaminase
VRYAPSVYGSVQNGTPFRVVVLAGSQGALAVSSAILAALPEGLPAPLLLVHHRQREDSLTQVLSYRSGRAVEDLTDGRAPQAGGTYLAPAGAVTRLAASGHATVETLPEGTKPLRAADELLISAAEAYGESVLAVVLSGRLDDGAAGVGAVRRHGGRVLVQHPGTAAQPGMPNAALATGCVDLCLPPRIIAAAITTFLTVPGSAALFRTRPPTWAPLVGTQPAVA